MTPTAGRTAVVLALAGVLGGCSGLEPPAPQGALSGAPLVQALREGGHVLYLRHTKTDPSQDDETDPLGDCTRQRLLTDEGRADARALGEALRRLEVPVGEVVASPFCRARETAELAFGRVRTDDGLVSPGPEGPARERTADRLRELVSTPPEHGSNTVLVGHLPNLRLVSRATAEEGGTVVLRPDDDGRFRVVAQVPPQGWQRLAERHAEPR